VYSRVIQLRVVTLLVAAVACQPQVNTLPPPVSPSAPIQYYDLDVPADLEVRSVDFSATTFADASGLPGGAVSSTVGGRAFVRVHAVRRDSREQVLLLYEDIAHRRRPIQVIRFHPSVEQTTPDSTHQSERRQ
jgi:hypothetical protein